MSIRIYLSRPHMNGAELPLVHEAFASNFVAPIGPQLDQFERTVSAYLDGRPCVALSSGTAALHLALRLSGVGPGDEVWISSMTFAGGVFPVLYQGARPVFFDLDPASWTISVDLLEDRLAAANRANRLPRAIVPTDLYGQSVDLPRIEALAERYGVALVVDAAESLGARGPGGRRCGTGGQVSILSFNGNKIITASGGGMLVSATAELANQARFLATQARDPAPHYEHSTFGYNYRMSNVMAAIGQGQMMALDDRVAARRAVFDRYHAALAPRGVIFMPEPPGYRSTRWLTAALFPARGQGADRETVRQHLLQHGIESRPLWKPMHLQPLFAGTDYVGDGFDARAFDLGLCLPSGSDLTESEQTEVIDRILRLIDAS